MTIRVRLTLWYLLTFGLALIGLTVLLYSSLSRGIRQEFDRSLLLKAAEIHMGISSKGEQYLSGEPNAAILLLPPADEYAQPGIYVQILGPHGNVRDTSTNLQGRELPMRSDQIAEGLAGMESIHTVTMGESQQVRVVTKPLIVGGQVYGLVQVGQSLQPVEDTIRQIGLISAFSALCVIVLAGLSGWFLAKKAFESVDKMIARAQVADASSGPGRRLHYEGPEDEIARLVRTLNGMLERVEESVEAQKRFIADSSHELRTPLTAIRGNVDLLERETDEQSRSESLDSIKREAERMSRIVQNLLLLAQLDAQSSFNPHEVELDTLLLDVFRQAKVMAGSRRVQLGNEDVATVKGDADQLKQMLLNLVDNAIKYTPPDGQITLALYRDDQWARIEVADTGVGIPEEHLPHIFDRFYRVDKVRSRSQGGTGLGLAIVKSIAELHGGQVTVTSSVGQGSSFAVWLRL